MYHKYNKQQIFNMIKRFIEFITESTNIGEQDIINCCSNALEKSHLGSFGNGLVTDCVIELSRLCDKLPLIMNIEDPRDYTKDDLNVLPDNYVVVNKRKYDKDRVFFVNKNSQYATPRRGLVLPNDTLCFGTSCVTDTTTNLQDNYRGLSQDSLGFNIYRISPETVDEIWKIYLDTLKRKREEKQN